jgi:hypothetical protein
MITEHELCTPVDSIIPAMFFTMLFLTFCDLTMAEHTMKHVGNNTTNKYGKNNKILLCPEMLLPSLSRK